MRRTSRMAHALALAVLAFAGCADAQEQKPLSAGVPPSPTSSGDAGGDTASTVASVGTMRASAPESGDVQPNSTITPTQLPPGSLATPSPVSAPPLVGPGLGAEQPSPDAPEPEADGPRPDAPEPGPVGPAASFEDPSRDAHGAAGIEALSQPSFDLLRVAWDPVSYGEQGRRGYSTSITIAGPAREDGAYVAYGFFFSGGEECELYHILELGMPAYAHGFCGSTDDGTRRFLGRMNGRPVTSSPTAAGETTLVGTFDDPVVPYALEGSGRTLYSLSAFTALCSPSADGCATHHEVWDWASSTQSFRV